jgi:tetratricopeptide (TPR) repeat protein
VAALLRGGPLWYRAVAQTLIAVAKQGKIDEVLRWVDEACGAAPAPDAGNMQVVCLAWATSFLLVASKQKEADALMERIAGIVPALAEPDPQALALVQQAQAARASLLGQPAACLAALEAAQAAFQQAGDARNASAVRANVGFMLAEHGAWDRAEEQLRAALADAERMGLAEQRAVVLHNLGRVVAVRGDLAAGERLEREALDSFIAQGEPRLEGIARLYLGDIKRLAGDAAEAEAEAARAVRVLAGAPASQVAARALLARALHAQGRTAEALEAARQAADDLAVLGSIDEGEADVRLVHAECLWAAGLAEQARQVIARAHARLVERADSISDPALRARFLSGIAAHTRTMELAAAWTDAAREGRGGRAADAA